MASKLTPDQQEKIWQQDSDARTLSEAGVIRKDKARLKGAVTGAKRIVKDENQRIKSLNAVSNLKIKK